MSTCEICGKETGRRWVVELESSKVKVCRDCKSHGRVIRREKKKKKKKSKAKKKKRKKKKKREIKKEIDPEYSEKIRREREKRNLTQKELSDQINETRSRIRKIEKGKMKPTKKIARKLEKKLNIDLFTSPEEIKPKKRKKKKSKKTTIGDIIELKKEE